MFREPYIQIGDHVLTEAQASAVRVAITDFRTQVAEPEMKAALGPIGDAYHARLTEVLKIILEKQGPATVIDPELAEHDKELKETIEFFNNS